MENRTIMNAQLEVPVSALNSDYKNLLSALTVPNPQYKNASFFGKGFVKKDIPKNLTFFGVDSVNRKISIPRNLDEKYIRKGVQIDYQLARGRKIGAGHDGSFKLRPKQSKFFDEVVNPYIDNCDRENLDILLNAQCGSGKTIMALYLASLHERNTLVCVTTTKIGNQFIKAVKALFPLWTVGWADDPKTYDITVGTYALLSQETYDKNFFRNYGHIVLDEFHRCGAETYSKVLEKSPSKYRTSLTATFRRKDGLHKILQWHAGKILEMERDEIQATIYPVSTGHGLNEILFKGVGRFSTKFENLEMYVEVCVKDPKTKKEIDRGLLIDHNKAKRVFTLSSALTDRQVEYTAEHPCYNLGTISAPMVDTEISENDARTEQVFQLVRQLYRNGRKTIVLSKRKDQLYKLERTLSRYGVPCAIFVSDKDPDYKKYCERKGRTIAENEYYAFNEASVLLGIDKLAEEGMDAPLYDTLVYAHTIKDIEQSIGRILRETPEGCKAKNAPLAAYLIDRVTSYNNAFYSKKGAKAMFEDLGHVVKPEIGINNFIEELSHGKI